MIPADLLNGPQVSPSADAECESGEGQTEAEDKSKPKFGGRRRAIKVKDRKTGEVYESKSKAGKAVAAEYGLDPGTSSCGTRLSGRRLRASWRSMGRPVR